MKPTHKGARKQISIRAKIFLALLCIIVVTLALLWLCQVILYDVVFSNVRINEIRSTARHVMLYCDQNAFSTQLSSACNKNDLCAITISPDGSVRHTVENSTACLIHHLPRDKRQDLINMMANRSAVMFGVTHDPARNSFDVTELTTLPFPDGTNVLYLCTITHDGEELLLVLDGVISPIGTVTKTSASFLIILSLILLPLAVLLAQYLSKLIAKPITKISHQAKGLAHGEYSPVSSNSAEIDELNRTLTQAALDLKQVERLRHELIANISHDLRTPLTLMGGYLEMMRDFPDEITEENFTTVLDETRRLSSLISDMLDISRLENGVMTPTPSPFCLTDAIEKTVASYDEFTRRDGYRFSFEYDKKVTVNADKILILQVVTNLINNAITYTGDDKVIALCQSVTDSHVRIEVTDTGGGIPEDKLPLIWDRYYKVDAAHKRAAKGTGLGLSIVRQVITLHGGSYGVRSKINEGSTFWFDLPIVNDSTLPLPQNTLPVFPDIVVTFRDESDEDLPQTEA